MVKTGMCVGRFQIPELHSGHRLLLSEMMKPNNVWVVVLGCTEAKTLGNALSYDVRVQMFKETFLGSNIIFERLDDHPDDKVWSQRLDAIISKYENVTLYGSRDSFSSAYSGSCPYIHVEPHSSNPSGTAIRNSIDVQEGPSFRAGIIYAKKTDYPKVYPTVDVAVTFRGNVLLGKKKDQTQWRFPGGFVDPTDTCMAEAARREVREECGIRIIYPKYITSMLIDDHRYRGSKDRIMTSFFTAKSESLSVKAGDDLEELKWVPIGNLLRFSSEGLIVKEHIQLVSAFLLTYNR